MQERVYARHAGIGWIGKNTCVIHPELGSFVFLAEILCSLELEADAPDAEQVGIKPFGRCGVWAPRAVGQLRRGQFHQPGAAGQHVEPRNLHTVGHGDHAVLAGWPAVGRVVHAGPDGIGHADGGVGREVDRSCTSPGRALPARTMLSRALRAS